ncbi:MAG: hypothetical protein K8W52_04015 [Deltaproteobacteria bacterium]|nr:hypothetical protein [Deltaproteobacteria bacterium]
MIARWLLAFVWTLALELPIYTRWLRGSMRSGWALCGLVFAVNAVSHPLLWFVMPRLTPYPLYLAVGETSVVIVEALIIAAALRGRPGAARLAFLSSLTANAFSTAVGLIVMPLFT